MLRNVVSSIPREIIGTAGTFLAILDKIFDVQHLRAQIWIVLFPFHLNISDSYVQCIEDMIDSGVLRSIKFGTSYYILL